MLLTTTPTIEGHTIQQYLGIVTSETIIGANVKEGKETALQEIRERAAAMGANAVVGIDLDYETVGAKGSMLMVVCSGTAVRVE